MQVQATPWHVVVFVMYRAMHLAALEVAVMHVSAHVHWVMAERCERTRLRAIRAWVARGPP